MQAVAGVAEVDQVRAGVRERDHARWMLQQWSHALVIILVELRYELDVQRQVKDIVQRVFLFPAGELSHRHSVAPDLRPVAGEQDAPLRMLAGLPQPVSGTP